jgi:hypothetical protein
MRSVSLWALDGAPVLCSDDGCMRLDLAQHSAAFVDRVAVSPALPLRADVKRQGDHWAACGGDACRPLGRRISRALDATHDKAEATLDLRAVVIDNVLWNVDRDRIVTLWTHDVADVVSCSTDKNPRRQCPSSGPEHDVSVLGDLLAVKWQGRCVEADCESSELVDREGRERGWIEMAGAVLRIDDQFFIAISELARIDVRDLHTGKQITELDPRLHESVFADVTPLGSTGIALMRSTGDGVRVSTLDVTGGDVREDADEMIVYDCGR